MTTETENINTSEARRLLLKVYKRFSSGEITGLQASQEAYLLNSILKSLEASGLDQLETGDVKFKVEFK
jgi:hypothetical protein